MAGARGVVEVTVAGAKRRLRLSLAAMDEIEVATGKPIAEVFRSLANQETIRIGTVRTIYRACCAAGGTPLSAEDEDNLLPGDLPDIIEAIGKLANEFAGDDEGSTAGKKGAPAKPRGVAGKR